LALVDVLASFSEVAVKNNYCRPTLNTSGVLNIVNGRHPVVEQLSSMPFVPNDTVLDSNANRCAIITGPNMAGKSTYMRQVAIIVLMAQIGSFVPATSADIAITDAIFTRVGASDDLASGQSTFMVEMSEVAHILKNATSKSLLILDEIGRGTSTYDGMSIARAVLEFVCDKKKIGAKTLFATHYHELTALEDQLQGVKNYNIAVKKRGDDITFLRRIVRGGADDSYGVEVAKLSGIPNAVIERAKEILYTLENEGAPSAPRFMGDEAEAQITFELHGAKQLLEELKLLDVNTLTPIECMTALNGFVQKAKEIK
jgi:DNA mismatch repair protein MutS